MVWLPHGRSPPPGNPLGALQGPFKRFVDLSVAKGALRRRPSDVIWRQWAKTGTALRSMDVTGLYGGLQGSLAAPLPSRMCSNTKTTYGFLNVSIVFHGHARRSPRCHWGAPWHPRSVLGLSLADPGTPESSLGESLAVLRGLLGEPLGVPFV